MPPENEQMPQAPDDLEEQQLCLSCMFPNAPSAHFCAKCGAPMSSYAATGPFESLFAEGHVYRQAADRPRNIIVVLGIWLIFGAFALTGIVMIATGGDGGLAYMIIGALMLAVSILIIGKTTRNYFARRQTDAKRDP